MSKSTAEVSLLLWIVPIGIETGKMVLRNFFIIVSELYLLELKPLISQNHLAYTSSELYLLELKLAAVPTVKSLLSLWIVPIGIETITSAYPEYFKQLWIVPIGIETLLSIVNHLTHESSELYLLELKPPAATGASTAPSLWIVPIGIETVTRDIQL